MRRLWDLAAPLLIPVVLLGASAALIAGFYISLYPTEPQTAFAGFDTAWYVWRGKLAAMGGLDALVGSADPPFRAQAFRAGFPLLAGFLNTIASIAPREFVFALPALVGVITGLGAGAFAVAAAREPRWAFPIYAVGVGASINLILTGVDHLEHLLVTGVIMAAATTAVLVASLRPAMLATVILLGSGALIHWSFVAFFAAFLAVLAALLVPGSLRSARTGEPVLGTPSARLAGTILGAAVLGSGALAATPEPPVLPGTRPELFLDRLGRDLPRIGPLGGLAALGILAYARPRDRQRRVALALTSIWAVSPLAGIALSAFVRAPLHRLLAFAFGIPLLASAGVVLLARRSFRIPIRPLGAILGLSVIAAALLGGVLLAREGWRDPPSRRAIQLAQAEVAGDYLARVEGDRPVVFVIDPALPPLRERVRLHFDLIRSALPADQIRRTHVYVGQVERLLEGQPTSRPSEGSYDQISRATWEGMRYVLDRDPIIIMLGFANRERPEGALTLARGVAVVRGPSLPEGPADELPIPTRPTTSRMVGIVAGSLALLTLVGLGWSASLVPAGWMTRTALAPALGISVLVLGGATADRVGVGEPGHRVWLVAVLAAVGWVGALVSRFRKGRRHDLP